MRTVLCILFLLLVGVPLLAEEGGADKTPDLPKELSQFDFVIGEWDVHIFWRGKDGKWVDYNATWRCSRLAGEYMVHQDWDGPYLKGSEFKAWDKKKKKWVGHNFYAGGEWAQTESEFVNGEMIVFISGVSDDRGRYLNRETYSDISEDSFQMKSDRSYDDGKTWEPGRYRLEVTRKQ
ncbi:MAG: hypothetical protein HN521_18345 [Candidatus Latescibacteria bacterium]|jgi:hypothetical protein|nr:hypothetical protein [Candidatus Latescibacterota bacterium]MBT5831942.1 hypothetical protein [Candidatus Latescibacterota bacterium]